MLIALDYDGTYTADPALWCSFIDLARARGHLVHVVTMRAHDEPVRLGTPVDVVHYTDRRAKRPYMEARGLHVQVWVDDRPEFIGTDAAPRDVRSNATSGLWTNQGA